MTDQERTLLLTLGVAKPCEWHELDKKADIACPFCLQEAVLSLLSSLARKNNEIEAAKSEVASNTKGSNDYRN